MIIYSFLQHRIREITHSVELTVTKSNLERNAIRIKTAKKKKGDLNDNDYENSNSNDNKLFRPIRWFPILHHLLFIVISCYIVFSYQTHHSECIDTEIRWAEYWLYFSSSVFVVSRCWAFLFYSCCLLPSLICHHIRLLSLVTLLHIQ